MAGTRQRTASNSVRVTNIESAPCCASGRCVAGDEDEAGIGVPQDMESDVTNPDPAEVAQPAQAETRGGAGVGLESPDDGSHGTYVAVDVDVDGDTGVGDRR